MIVEIPIDVWDPARGGAEGYLFRLSKGLAERGHRVRVLCLRSNQAFEGFVEVERLPVPAWPRWRRELVFARAALERRRRGSADVTLAVRHALEADVYQPHGGPFRIAVGASLEGIEPAALRALKRLLRRLQPKTLVLLWLDREIFRRSPGLITISLSGKVEEDFRRAYPDETFRFERIYNGVDLAEFHDRDRAERACALRGRFGISASSRIGLFVGHKFGPKGLLDGIRALREVPDLHLIILGGGRPGRYRGKARALGVSERVHFAGASSDPRPFYAASDILVHPTRYDPCSLAVLEALACGLPVVTTTANGAGELLSPGKDGFVVAPGDPGALARAIRDAAADWDRFHERALEKAKGLSFEDHLNRIEEVLRQAAEERKAGRS